MIWWLIFFGLEVLLQRLSFQSSLGVINRGISFGLAEGWFPDFAFIIFLVILLTLILSGKFKETGWWVIFFGGLSNAVSRLLFGGVVDYLHWTLGFDLWFNLADVAIVFGMILTVYQIRKKHGNN